MPHVQIDREWTSTLDVDALRDRITLALKQSGVAVVSPPGATPIQFRGGSGCLTRLIGGWFVGLSTLPKAGTVEIVGQGGATVVKLHVEDALGMALVDAMFAKRFEKSFEPVVAAVEKAAST